MNAPFRIRPFDFAEVFDAGGGSLADSDVATLRRRVHELEADLAADDRDAAGRPVAHADARLRTCARQVVAQRSGSSTPAACTCAMAWLCGAVRTVSGSS